MTPSLARTFYETITQATDPVAHLRSFVNAPIPVEELDWRDFKADPGNEEKRKDLWSKAVSGFANNQGGVLVWGLDARKNASDVDCVCKECPVDKPFAFKSRLIELHRDAADPPLPNVEYEAYLLPNDPDRGFVVCLVPEGAHKPYRALYCKNKPFYMRCGDSFTIPSVSVLRSLFYPRTEAVFEVTATLGYTLTEKHDRSRVSAQFTCTIYVKNCGRATAKDLYITGNTSCKRFEREYRCPHDWAMTEKSDGTVIWTARRSLHPGMSFAPTCLIWSVDAVAQQKHGTTEYIPKLDENILLRMVFFAEGQGPQESELAFSLDTLIVGNGQAVTQKCKSSAVG